MLTKFIRITLRNLQKNIVYASIVTIGLALGFTTILALVQWAGWHVSYDKHIPDYHSIYRLSLKEKTENFERHTARIIHGDIVDQLHELDLPEIIDIVRIAPFRNAIVKKDDILFYENNTYACDPSFFRIFYTEIVQGNENHLLDAPQKVIISKTIAEKYFGKTDPVGKFLEITHQFGAAPEKYEITGIFNDFPLNTHFKIDILTSFEDPENYSSTAWVYALLNDGADPNLLKEKIQNHIYTNNDSTYTQGLETDLTRLEDIHLGSHLAREIGKNINKQNLYILLLAGVLVFVLAWFNFTLLTISQNQVNIKKLIYQWQTGASRNIFLKQFFVEFGTIGFIGFLLSLITVLLLNNPLNQLFGIPIFQNTRLFIVSIIGLFALMLLSSLFTSWYATNRLYRNLRIKYFSSQKGYYFSGSSKNWFIKAVIIGEFIITFILISNLLSINHQLNYSIQNQIGSNDFNTIQMPDLPRPVIDNFAVFRDELQKYPDIEITAMMEEPGGMAMDAFQYSIEGYPDNESRLFVFPVEENFIRFYNLEIIAGHDFPGEYNLQDTTEFYMLNETAAKLLDNNYENIIGRELQLDLSVPGIIYPGNVIGVVKDFHLSDMGLEIGPMVIFPEYTWLYCFSVRLTGNVNEGISVLRKTWQSVYPDYPFRYFFTSEMYNMLYADELTEIKALGLFSLLTVLIAGMGLFALSGFFMNQKIPAAAIRKIHGAEIRHILIPELRQYVVLAIISSLIAFPIAWFTMQQWRENLIYRTEIQYWIFPAITIFVILFSCIAVLYHAIKLSRLNPVDLLKSN